MEAPEITQLKKRIKYSNIIIAVLILVSLGFFFYGMINNVRMKQERAIAIQVRTNYENALRENERLSEQLEKSEQEILATQKVMTIASDLAFAQAEKARLASEKAEAKAIKK